MCDKRNVRTTNGGTYRKQFSRTDRKAIRRYMDEQNISINDLASDGRNGEQGRDNRRFYGKKNSLHSKLHGVYRGN